MTVSRDKRTQSQNIIGNLRPMTFGRPLHVEMIDLALRHRPKGGAWPLHQKRLVSQRITNMAGSELPRHIVDRFERRWAQKLEAQARTWQSAKPDRRTSTDRGVPVVRLASGRSWRKSRLSSEAAFEEPSIPRVAPVGSGRSHLTMRKVWIYNTCGSATRR